MGDMCMSNRFVLTGGIWTRWSRISHFYYQRFS